MAEPKDYSKQKAGTTISPTKFGRLLEKLGFKEGLNYNQKLMKPVQMSIKAVDQALKAAKWAGAGRLAAAQAVYALATSDTRSPTKDKDRGSPSKSSKVVTAKMDAAKKRLAERRAKKSSPPLRPKDFISGQKTTTILKGDTYGKISKKFNVPIDKLRKLNNYEDKKLPIGKTLKLK